MRIALLLVVASCTVPAFDSSPACPSGQEQCGLAGDTCFDPTTSTCCGPFLAGGDICALYQTCAPTSPNSLDGSCQPAAWFNVVCPPGTFAPGQEPSRYRGSYQVQPQNEALVGTLPTHEYELELDDGCSAIQPQNFSGNPATVTFDGTAHTAKWATTATDAGPLTFSGDPTLGLTSIAVRSWDGTGFHGDVTDANGTHTVAFTFTFARPTP